MWFGPLGIIQDYFYAMGSSGFLGQMHSAPCIYFGLRLFCGHLSG